MTEKKAFKIGLALIVGCTVIIPALAGISMPTGVDDMGPLAFLLTFAFLGACVGVLAAKIPKKYIRQ
jgi:hypothetical protein